MKDDFHLKDNNDSFVTDFIKDNSSLPPRSTVHRAKGNEDSGSNKIFRIFFSSFAFVIIISLILFFLLSDNFWSNTKDKSPNENEVNSTQDNVDDNNIDDPLNSDDIIIDDNPIEVDESEDVILDVIEKNDPIVEDEPSVAAPSNVDKTHIVLKGETLYKISLQYYGPGYIEELAEYNNIEDSSYVTEGMILKIPNIELLK